MTNWTKEEQAEHRRLWVKALRSGDYEQARSALAEYEYEFIEGGPYKFCCLGVACDISGLGVWNIDSFYGSYAIENSNEQSESYLPSAVQHWLGLKTDNGCFDVVPVVFDEISDVAPEMFDEIFDVAHEISGVLPLEVVNNINLSHLNDAGYDFMAISKIIERAEELGMLED